MKTFILLLLTVITFVSVALAQVKKDKIEIGPQVTSLSLFHPDFPFDDTQVGVGGRVTYNFNRSIAAEAEINFFPQKQSILNADGNAIQAQFGVKIGKRFEKFGIFGKVRPGFLSVDRVASLLPDPTAPFGIAIKIEREEFFTIDTGGVLELYPSSRTVVRFEAGDTMIRHPERFGQVGFVNPSIALIRDAKFKHNFQFTFGVGFRLGDFPEEQLDAQTSDDAQGGTRRYEVGVQVTSLIVEPAAPVGLTALALRKHAEPGFGGRFTFNLTDNVAFEGEGNYFTRLQGFPDGGHMFQGQFGAKVGKRFNHWGVFGKARPGFIGFTRVVAFPFGAQVPAVIPSEKRLYPSLDVGGVVEFYISPRWMARFDVGDTIIRYGEVRFSPTFVIRTQQTIHNLQLSPGIAFRF